MTSTDVSARSVKVSVPVADADFPIGPIPPKGFPGSAKARISLRLRTPGGIELMADPAAKGLQRALEAAQAAPGGLGGPVAAEPKMHFSPKLLHKGLNPENIAVPEARTDPNGTKKVSHVNVPIGSTSMKRYPHGL